MGIERVVTLGDRRQSPFYPIPAQEESSKTSAPSGSFEDVLRLALARTK